MFAAFCGSIGSRRRTVVRLDLEQLSNWVARFSVDCEGWGSVVVDLHSGGVFAKKTQRTFRGRKATHVSVSIIKSTRL